jgi:hypothetical protein
LLTSTEEVVCSVCCLEFATSEFEKRSEEVPWIPAKLKSPILIELESPIIKKKLKEKKNQKILKKIKKKKKIEIKINL